MNRIVRAAGITAAGCLLVAGGAGVAQAHGDHGHHGQKGHHSHQGGNHGKSQGKSHKQGGKKQGGKKEEGKKEGGGHREEGYGGHREEGYGGYGGGYGAYASAVAFGSPGVLSGNVVQVPIDIPLNICGNSINILAAFNPTFGNVCINK